MRNRIEVLMQWDPKTKDYYWSVACIQHMGPQPAMAESKCYSWLEVTDEVHRFMETWPPSDASQ